MSIETQSVKVSRQTLAKKTDAYVELLTIGKILFSAQALDAKQRRIFKKRYDSNIWALRDDLRARRAELEVLWQNLDDGEAPELARVRKLERFSA